MAEKVVIGNAELWHGDCREILPTLDACAIVSDPPYGIAYQHSGGGAGIQTASSKVRGNKAIHGDAEAFDPGWMLALSDNVLLFGADHFYKRLPDSGRWLAWNKLGHFPPMGDVFSDVEFAWHSANKPAKIFSHLWKGLAFSQVGERDGLVNGRASRLHPTQKPVQLMAWCIQQAGAPAVVCDPYMGSGTTGVAAVELGLSFVGIEIDADYFRIACDRIARASAQPRLFEDAKVGAGDTAVQGDMLLPANAKLTGSGTESG